MYILIHFLEIYAREEKSHKKKRQKYMVEIHYLVFAYICRESWREDFSNFGSII